MKRLISNEEASFSKEVAVLKRFNDNRPHLISLLASYEQHGLYHLIFPWAQSDLHGFWREQKPGGLRRDRHNVLNWMAAQCHGIADGLSQIHYHRTFSGKSLLRADSIPKLAHNKPQSPSATEVSTIFHSLFGRHGDIKPENILWFPELQTSTPNEFGTLKIADFGIVEFSTQRAPQGRRRGSIANSPSYRAPETDLPYDDGMIRVSSSYDIWALGCVFLEFVTWWFGGWKLVEGFRLKRCLLDPVWYGPAAREEEVYFSDTFFTIIKGHSAEVKESVSKVSPLCTRYSRWALVRPC